MKNLRADIGGAAMTIGENIMVVVEMGVFQILKDQVGALGGGGGIWWLDGRYDGFEERYGGR